MFGCNAHVTRLVAASAVWMALGQACLAESVLDWVYGRRGAAVQPAAVAAAPAPFAAPACCSPQPMAAPVMAAPIAAAPTYAQPAFTAPSYVQPTYAQPTYAQPSYAQPSYAQPSYAQPAACAQPACAPACPQPVCCPQPTCCPQPCSPMVCQRVVQYRRQTAYRTAWNRVPVTYYRPFLGFGARGSMRACNSFQWQANRVPYTTYAPIAVQSCAPSPCGSCGSACNTCGPATGCSSCGMPAVSSQSAAAPYSAVPLTSGCSSCSVPTSSMPPGGTFPPPMPSSSAPIEPYPSTSPQPTPADQRPSLKPTTDEDGATQQPEAKQEPAANVQGTSVPTNGVGDSSGMKHAIPESGSAQPPWMKFFQLQPIPDPEPPKQDSSPAPNLINPNDRTAAIRRLPPTTFTRAVWPKSQTPVRQVTSQPRISRDDDWDSSGWQSVAP